MPNSVKTVPNRLTAYPRLQHGDELHQKDLRKVVYFLQIWGPENEVYSQADMFPALSLIVGI